MNYSSDRTHSFIYVSEQTNEQNDVEIRKRVGRINNHLSVTVGRVQRRYAFEFK